MKSKALQLPCHPLFLFPCNIESNRFGNVPAKMIMAYFMEMEVSTLTMLVCPTVNLVELGIMLTQITYSLLSWAAVSKREAGVKFGRPR